MQAIHSFFVKFHKIRQFQAEIARFIGLKNKIFKKISKTP